MSFFASYYRTDREDIINARKVDQAGNEYVGQRGRAFAALFDAVAYFSPGLACHFMGIGFNAPIRQQGLWAPAIPGNPLRRPADSRKVPQKLRAQHEALAEKWNAHLPTGATKPRQSELLKVIGLSEASFVNGHQLHIFMEDDEMWLISTLPLDLPEVLGSEVRAAQARVEAAAAVKVAEASVAAAALESDAKAVVEGAQA